VVRGLASLPAGAADSPRAGEDARTFSLRVVRERVAAAGIEGPVVVVYLLPPFYPAAPPGRSPWIAAASAALEREGVPTRPFFPFISDASYLSARGMPAGLGAHMPAWERPYRLPAQAMAALDLDVLNLGPWGRDAHGVGERVNAEWAFERLPALIIGVVKTSEAA
jgi:arginine utilization protein RocB